MEQYAGGTTIQYNVFPNTTTSDKKRIDKIDDAYNIINRLDAKFDRQGPAINILKPCPKVKHSVISGGIIQYLSITHLLQLMVSMAQPTVTIKIFVFLHGVLIILIVGW